MRFREDNRGQSLGISNFILALVAGAIVYYFAVVRVGSKFLEQANPESQTTGWLVAAGEAMPIVFAVVALFGILLRAVRQRGAA